VTLGAAGPLDATAASFDGINDNVAMGSPTDLDLGGDVAVEAWVYPGAADDSYIVYGAGRYKLGTATTGYQFSHIGAIGQPSEVVSFGSLTTGAWVHLVGVRDTASRTLIGYINGEEAGRAPYARPASGASFVLRLSDLDIYSPFTGRLAHVAIYDHVLSPGRVAAHYAASFDSLPEQSSGPHLGAILDITGWPSAERYMPTGVSQIIASEPSGNALSWMLGVAETTEEGLLSVYMNGYVNFIDRQALLTRTSTATFGDGGGGEIAYSDIAIRYDDADLWSTVSVSGASGEAHSVTDATAKARYGPRTLEVSGSMTANENELTDEATYLLGKYKVPTARVESLTFVAYSDAPTLVQIFTRDIGDRITVKRRPPGGGTITQDCVIEGVRHTYTPTAPWETEWSLVPADINTYFVLDTSTLDGAAVLAY
jgi:hypothetical protein